MPVLPVGDVALGDDGADGGGEELGCEPGIEELAAVDEPEELSWLEGWLDVSPFDADEEVGVLCVWAVAFFHTCCGSNPVCSK